MWNCKHITLPSINNKCTPIFYLHASQINFPSTTTVYQTLATHWNHTSLFCQLFGHALEYLFIENCTAFVVVLIIPFLKVYFNHDFICQNNIFRIFHSVSKELYCLFSETESGIEKYNDISANIFFFYPGWGSYERFVRCVHW